MANLNKLEEIKVISKELFDNLRKLELYTPELTVESKKENNTFADEVTDNKKEREEEN